MTVPIAHAGHWIAGLLYMLPVFILMIAVAWQRRQDRRNPPPDVTSNAEQRKNST